MWRLIAPANRQRVNLKIQGSIDDSGIEDHVFRLSYRRENGVEELQYEAPQ
ncbi:MAG: hypothetical protein WA173_11985 [Pseudomonas sp.]|uniref:hypothetical protein n=1 Tax=Pseudomonas sp. TaxID=306 RepID=UPI003BB80AD6